MMSIAVKVKYFDTSAIVKLFLNEEGSKRLRDYYNNHTSFCCTEMTFYEAMGALKKKLFKGKTKNRYFKSIEELALIGWGGKLEIEKVKMNDFSVFKEVHDIAVKYNIDVADAIQIFAILKGRYSVLTGNSKTVLITADGNLEKACQDLKIRVWNCGKVDKPDWLDN
jgi:predicted nucleic acid-binding protein